MTFQSCKTPKPVKAVYTSRNDLSLYLYLLDTNPKIQKFLRYDYLFCLADKYLIAMVFIYFKRARLNPEHYTSLSFFAALLLAHSMEEDIEITSEIYSWALEDKVKDLLPELLKLKILLWEAMDYRAAVSQHCCSQLISISQSHPVWQRERTLKSLNFFSASEISQNVRKSKLKREIL